MIRLTIFNWQTIGWAFTFEGRNDVQDSVVDIHSEWNQLICGAHCFHTNSEAWHYSFENAVAAKRTRSIVVCTCFYFVKRVFRSPFSQCGAWHVRVGYASGARILILRKTGPKNVNFATLAKPLFFRIRVFLPAQLPWKPNFRVYRTNFGA